MSPAPEAFHVLRAAGFVAGLGPLLEDHRELLKPDVVWNIEVGLAMPADRLGAAERARGAVHAAMTGFLESYDVLICPSACVAPFPVETRWPRQVDGVVQETYIDWLRITSAITLTGCPVVALPCGLNADGVPIGLQLVGGPHGEHALLSAAAAVEEILGFPEMLPVRPPRSG